jgi:hypothetical protein
MNYEQLALHLYLWTKIGLVWNGEYYVTKIYLEFTEVWD